MLTTCTICQARYQLDGTKVPKKVIRVRCPACSGVFVLDGTAPPLVTDFQTEESVAPIENQDTFAPDPVVPSAAAVEESIPVEKNDTWEIPVEPNSQQAQFTPEPALGSVAATETPISAPATATIAPAPARTKRRRSKEEMLARALVSDILVYNRDLRDDAIKEGKLLEVLGGEIKKSWELYKEKVTPDVANNTNHFREALNEILAEGEKVF